MKANIKEAKYLWNNRAGHDKVYGLFQIDKVVVKVWGRRTSTLRFEKIDNPEPLYLQKKYREEVGRGYDDVANTDPQRTKIIKDINAVLDNFVFDTPATSVLDRQKQAFPVPTPNKPLSAICLNNVGIAQYFDKGVEYFYVRDNGNDTIVIEDALGKERTVLKERFKVK